MIVINLLNANIKIDIEIQSSQKEVFNNYFKLHSVDCSPYHIRIKIDDNFTICSLNYDLESYEVGSIEKDERDNRVNSIAVEEDTGSLIIIFINNGFLCRFVGKIVKENVNGEN